MGVGSQGKRGMERGSWGVKHSRSATHNYAMKSDTLSARVRTETEANLLNALLVVVALVDAAAVVAFNYLKEYTASMICDMA